MVTFFSSSRWRFEEAFKEWSKIFLSAQSQLHFPQLVSIGLGLPYSSLIELAAFELNSHDAQVMVYADALAG